MLEFSPFKKKKDTERKGLAVGISPPLLRAYLYRIQIICILLWNDVLIALTTLAVQLATKYTLTSARVVPFSRNIFLC